MKPSSQGPLVVVLDDGYDSYDTERGILAAIGGDIAVRACRGRADAVRAAIVDADVVLVRESPINAEAIANAPRLRGVVRYGIGLDNVDCEAARGRGIYVANVPDYSTEDVSDHALALLMGVARRLVQRDREVRDGVWFTGSSQKMYRPHGRTLGLVGYGRIAQAFERKMRAVGVARVLVHDPFARLPETVMAADMETLARESDYISLHAPLTPQTHHILNADRIALMKPTAIIVNTARGSLIDEVALAGALEAGRIFGAGLDVFETEPPAAANPLLWLPNVILSDHAGWYSEESVADLQRKAADEVVRILSGQKPLHWANPW